MDPKISERIKLLKPTLSDSSLKLYLNKLKKFSTSKGKMPVNTFNNFDEIIEKVNSMSNNVSTKKSILTAIVIFLQSAVKPNHKLINKYKEPMVAYMKKEGTDAFKQEKSKKQEKNWVSMDQFTEIINKMQSEIKTAGLLVQSELSNKQYTQLQHYIIMRLFHEYPFRNDIASLNIVKSKENLDDKKNYLVTNKEYTIVLNNYKTSKKYGTKEYVLKPQLKKLIKKLLKHQECGYLLCNTNRKGRMTRNNLTQTLQKIFMKYTGKNVSSSMLRHIQASEINKDKATLAEERKEDEKIEDKFLHNRTTNLLYTKKE